MEQESASEKLAKSWRRTTEILVDKMGNGEWFELTNNPTEMYASLMNILDDICKAE